MSRTTRRTFLERSLLTATAVAASPRSSPFARAPRASRGDKIRVGVIGVRGRGRAHIGGFKNSPDSEVVAICDPDEQFVGRALELVPDATYHKDLRALLDDKTIDAITVATPNHWHSLASIWALQAGKHVYVEKPLTHNVREGNRLVAAGKKYGKVVQHGSRARTQPPTFRGDAGLL